MLQSTEENQGHRNLAEAMAGAVPPTLSDEQLKNILRASHEDFDWLDGLSINAEGSRLSIKFIHEYFAAWFMAHKQRFFEELLASNFKRKFQIFYEMPGTHPRAVGLSAWRVSKTGKTEEKRGEPGEEDSFSSFITNDNNEFALAAARNAAMPFGKNSPENQIRLLVICGPAGTGKSHLLNAICAQIRTAEAGSAAIKENASFFCANYPMLFNRKHADIFWRRHPFLILDDLQELTGKTGWQNILASYVDLAMPVADPIYADNSLAPEPHTMPQRLIFAFSGHAADLQKLDKRLWLRLESGLVVELPEPNLDIRIRYVEKANRKLKLALGREQILGVARSSTRIPALTGILRKIEFFRGLHGRNPDIGELETIMGAGAKPAAPDWREILATVSRKFGIKPDDIMSPSRKPEFVLARQITMYLCRRNLGFSYPELGKIFGGRDHSTVIHSIRKIKSMAETNKEMHNLLTELEKITQ